MTKEWREIIDMLELYILEISKNLEMNDYNRLLSNISVEKQGNIARFRNYEDAQRSLLGESLARYSICQRLKIKNSQLVFATSEHGKPILPPPHEIYFNISHSGNWVVCAVDNNPVGIDIEVVKPINLIIAEKFFSRDELKALMNQPAEMKLKYFYILWTLKESFIKAEGKGLSIPLNSFSMTIDKNSINIITDHNSAINYNFFLLFNDDKVVCSVCSTNTQYHDYFLNIEQLMEKYILIL